MADLPWQDDACSLVDAFRSGERSPLEELDATLAAIDASDLNAFSFVDPERARAAAAEADASKPFGGVPTGIKELELVEGWPQTEASLVFRDRIATQTAVHVERLLDGGGAVPVGQTTASEFGGLNVSVTRLHGVTHNPWRYGRTVGGSSGGSAAAVAGGLVALATGGDGGGSIRIPASYTGLLGMKGTFGRISRSPRAYMRPNTIVLGNVARSVRDAARYFDVCGGYDSADPSTLPKHPGFEAALGTHDLQGRRVAVVPGLGGVPQEVGLYRDADNAAANKLVDLKLQRESLLSRYRPDAQPVRDIDVQISQLQSAVAAGRAEGPGALRTGLNPVFQTLQTDKLQLAAEVAAARQSLAALSEQDAQVTQRRLRLDQLEPRFQALSRDRDVLAASVRDFTVKEEQGQASRQIAAATNDDIRIVERAVAPAEGKSLRTPMLALALLFAAFCAGCAGVMRMVLRPGMPTPASAARTLDLPVLGVAAAKA